MKRLLLSIGLLPVLAASASAETWQATKWMAPAHTLNEFPYQQFAKDVAEATDGAMELEIYSSGALVPAPTTCMCWSTMPASATPAHSTR